jgi:hypothetical protein
MTIRLTQFISLLLMALTMGLTFAHTLESAPKLRWNGELYLAVQTNLYYLFGRVGAVVELGAVVSAITLTVLLRGQPKVFRWTLAGAVFFILSLIVWFIFVAPVNAQTELWQKTGLLPSDWSRWRQQWELAHAGSFLLHLCGFCALLWSMLLPRD